jgi:hypothetical protein
MPFSWVFFIANQIIAREIIQTRWSCWNLTATNEMKRVFSFEGEESEREIMQDIPFLSRKSQRVTFTAMHGKGDESETTKWIFYWLLFFALVLLQLDHEMESRERLQFFCGEFYAIFICFSLDCRINWAVKRLKAQFLDFFHVFIENSTAINR